MLYAQPLTTRFGLELIKIIGSKNWMNIDIAVAWVRASGVR
jgi:hypothetical protein